MEIPRLITILGPTAVGKTRLAALLAHRLGGEIISADSRQVYKGMTIGTGKDLDDYMVNGVKISYHMIDVAHPNEEFHVFRFKQLFQEAADAILQRGNQPVLCGGTGLYLDAVLRDYFFVEVPENQLLRHKLAEKRIEELASMLQSMRKVHNKTDLEDRERLMRAIEICEYHRNVDTEKEQIRIQDSCVFGVHVPREVVRNRISLRLSSRMNEGMVDEVEKLIDEGVSHQRLISFGLEYKFVTLYLLGHLTKQEMEEKLCIAIHQFAKRQMSWFRRMERLGVRIEWIDGLLPQEERAEAVLKILKKLV
jgi:tRNA dimethylallyltransferase